MSPASGHVTLRATDVNDRRAMIGQKIREGWTELQWGVGHLHLIYVSVALFPLSTNDSKKGADMSCMHGMLQQQDVGL